VKEMQKTEQHEYVVSFPENLNEQMQKYCKLLEIKPEELIKHAVDRFYGAEPWNAEVFFKGRKWMIPKSCFIVFALPYEEHRKLSEWVRREDRIQIHATANNEVIIVNETELSKRKAKPFKE